MRRHRGAWVAALAGVVARPHLWRTALGSARALAPPGWWRRPPFLPLPDRSYLAFRLETQYGSDGAPAPGDLVTYLEWCRSQHVIMRRARP
jgi:hypothetical protein